MHCYLRVQFDEYTYYRPQRSWGKVIFSEACVKNSVHIWEQCMLGDTGSKRVVYILLECILVREWTDEETMRFSNSDYYNKVF